MKTASATGWGRGLLRPLGIGVGAAMLVAALAMPEVAGAADAWAGTTGGTEGQTSAWWWWPLALFFVCFALGIVAVPAGVGGHDRDRQPPVRRQRRLPRCGPSPG